MKSLAKLFYMIGIGLLCVFGFLLWQRNTPGRVAFTNYDVQAVADINKFGTPEMLLIKDLNIQLPIIPSTIKNGRWEDTKIGVSYLADSPTPGDFGNSVLYGHNWKSLLGNVVYAKPGHTIEILYSNGVTKSFVVEHTQIVDPTDSSILAQTNDRRITLYTCTGFLDSKRYVVTALLKA